MASVLNNIAEPYDSSKNYYVKDMVVYNKLLYLCISSTSGEFDKSKWIEVQITDLIKGKLTGLEDYTSKSIDASYVESDDTYTYLGIPKLGLVDKESMVRTLNSKLVSKISMRLYNTGHMEMIFPITKNAKVTLIPNDGDGGLAMSLHTWKYTERKTNSSYTSLAWIYNDGINHDGKTFTYDFSQYYGGEYKSFSFYSANATVEVEL